MIKSITQLEHKIGDKVFHFLCDHDSPIQEVKESLCQFLGYVANVENAVKAQAEQKQNVTPTEPLSKE